MQNKTPLMLSIERKKEKVEELRTRRDTHKTRSISFKLYVEKIVTLLDEIKADEALLEVDRQHWIDAFVFSAHEYCDKPLDEVKVRGYAGECFTEKYGSNERV